MTVISRTNYESNYSNTFTASIPSENRSQGVIDSLRHKAALIRNSSKTILLGNFECKDKNILHTCAELLNRFNHNGQKGQISELKELGSGHFSSRFFQSIKSEKTAILFNRIISEIKKYHSENISLLDGHNDEIVNLLLATLCKLQKNEALDLSLRNEIKANTKYRFITENGDFLNENELELMMANIAKKYESQVKELKDISGYYITKRLQQLNLSVAILRTDNSSK